jgi:sorting nexin-4
MHGQVDPSEWGGKWMAIDVRDPVKEHEGSKDMFVSYAVRTRVSLAEAAVSTKSDAG